MLSLFEEGGFQRWVVTFILMGDSMSKKQTLIDFMRANCHLLDEDVVSWAMRKGLTNNKRSAQSAYAQARAERAAKSFADEVKKQEQPNLFEVPSIQDILIAHARQDKLDEILDMMVTILKYTEYRDLYSQAGCIKWASSKIKEGRIAKRLLTAYKRNPAIIKMAVEEVEGYDGSMD